LELNWSTFLLEIINFLVLVWILKRFFYKPVLAVIARRRESIEKKLADAGALHDEAVSLKSRYENRLVEWEKERQAAHALLDKEIETERKQRMEALQSALDVEREKARVIEQRTLEAARMSAEEKALALAGQFSTRLLSLAAGPEMEHRLIDLFLEELANLSAARLETLRTAAGKTQDGIQVTSAYPLDDDRRRSLERALGPALSVTPPFHYAEDRALLAGIRITLGAWVLGANLQDELKGFCQICP